MKLLNAEKIKTINDIKGTAQSERISQLRQEEIDTTKRINDLKDFEISEKKRIKEELKEVETECKSKKEHLTNEVDNFIIKLLDSKLFEKLSSLIDTYKKLIEKYKDKDEEIEKQKADIKEQTSKLVDKSITLIDREKEIVEKEKELDRREDIIKDIEKHIELKHKTIADNWIKFYNEVNETNKKFDERENKLMTQFKEIENERKINNSIRSENEKESRRLKNEDRLIKDKYLELQRSEAEFAKKYGRSN